MKLFAAIAIDDAGKAVLRFDTTFMTTATMDEIQAAHRGARDLFLNAADGFVDGRVKVLTDLWLNPPEAPAEGSA